MSLLLCAITTPPTSEARLALVRLNVGAVVAWASHVESAAEGFTRADVLEHHRLVTQVFDRVDACLPARFPTVVEDEAVLRQQLEGQQAELTERLHAVRGACELAVTAVWTTASEAPSGLEGLTPGRRYMEERRVGERRRVRALQAAEALESAAGHASRQVVRHLCPSKEIALSLGLLVERAEGGEVKLRLATQRLDDVRILVNGPWPPYSFVDRRPRSTPP